MVLSRLLKLYLRVNLVAMKLAAFLLKKFKYYIKHYFDPQEDGGYSYQQVRTMTSLVIGVVLFIILIVYIIKKIVGP